MTDDARPQSKIILVVDDEPSTLAYFQTLLSKEGFHVVTSNNSKTVLDKLKSQPAKKIDLIVLDMMMPGPGGYEVVKELQSTEYANVPVFIITSRKMDSGAISLIKLESNVSGFWSKPVQAYEFVLAVHELMGTHHEVNEAKS